MQYDMHNNLNAHLYYKMLNIWLHNIFTIAHACNSHTASPQRINACDISKGNVNVLERKYFTET